ncbi:hypothetical protein GDO81_008245 [Engystomops pustulosus]|uniref:Uncharacterized protein n=1 Tax=Engystomops pustulosus TaxID=76066 RepID=A0AAV7CD69_ENGPU|nr:hypothetical protein GDO81_008245 [Engystomops pustulosus]
MNTEKKEDQMWPKGYIILLLERMLILTLKHRERNSTFLFPAGNATDYQYGGWFSIATSSFKPRKAEFSPWSSKTHFKSQ